jgi:16S rRNA (guanine527-N7)-methyltransferase
MDLDQLAAWFAAHPPAGWQPDRPQLAQICKLYDGIVAGNKLMNLTRITSPEEFWEKHLWDSLWPVGDCLGSTTTLRALDIGTGGGFPGLPLAIARPDAEVTLLDSTRKKITFLQQLAEDLGLTQVRTLAERAETAGLARHYRSKFDLAMTRAVGPVTVCAEYAVPFLKIGGRAILYRGQWEEHEEADLLAAAEELGASVVAIERTLTPLTQAVRHRVILEKQTHTAADYPRDVGIPTQRPLGVVDC